MKSKTPQTDAAAIIRARINPGSTGFEQVVTVKFARSLELDLTRSKMRIRNLLDGYRYMSDLITEIQKRRFNKLERRIRRLEAPSLTNGTYNTQR